MTDTSPMDGAERVNKSCEDIEVCRKILGGILGHEHCGDAEELCDLALEALDSRATIANLTAKVDRLREALRPFQLLAKQLPAALPISEVLHDEPTVGDLRRAAKELETKP